MKLHQAKPFLNPENFIQNAISEGFEELQGFTFNHKIYVCDSLLDEIERVISDKNTLTRLEENIAKIGVSESRCRIYASASSVLFAKLEPPKLKKNIAVLNLCNFLPDGSLFLGWQALRKEDEWLIQSRIGGEKAAQFIKKQYPGHEEEYLRQFTRQTVQHVLFLEFVDVEQKIIEHKKNFKPAWGQPVKNRTGSDITIADINWQYDAERNTPFAVRGHWRLQRHGPGFSKIKLIWIKPFQKEGYKRKAGKRQLEE